METAIINNPLRKKTIELPESILHNLAQKAAEKKTSLKKYMESILTSNAEDLDDAETYARLAKEQPEGLNPAPEEEQQAFRKWLGV